MSLLTRLVSTLANETPKNTVREQWDRLSKLPGGKLLFSAAVGFAAPYTGTMHARIEDVRPGFAKVILKDRPGLRNHLGSIHAIALANLAELVGNSALAYSLPDDARFIVAGLSMDYVKKARGTLTATAQCDIPETSERREIQVDVTIVDASSEIVTRATLRSLIGPKKKA